MIDRISIITIRLRNKQSYPINFFVIYLIRVYLGVLIKTIGRHHGFHFIPNTCHATLSVHK